MAVMHGVPPGAYKESVFGKVRVESHAGEPTFITAAPAEEQTVFERHEQTRSVPSRAPGYPVDLDCPALLANKKAADKPINGRRPRWVAGAQRAGGAFSPICAITRVNCKHGHVQPSGNFLHANGARSAVILA